MTRFGRCRACALLLPLLLFAHPAMGGAPGSADASAPGTEEEPVDEGRRLSNPRAVVEWLTRLVGEYRVDGAVDLHDSRDAGQLEVQGHANCLASGANPAVVCTLNIRWPDAQAAEGIPGATPNLDPAVLMSSFDPERVGVHQMLISNDGATENAVGYLTSADTLVARASCAGVASCERVVRTTAAPDAPVHLEIGTHVGQRRTVTITITMHRIAGSVLPGNGSPGQ